jgi:hypothetical protein
MISNPAKFAAAFAIAAGMYAMCAFADGAPEAKAKAVLADPHPIKVDILHPGVREPKGNEFEIASRPLPSVPPKARDKFFRAAGIETSIADYDDLKRNQLIYRMQAWTPEKLHQFYPQIPLDALSKGATALQKTSPR